MFDTIILLTDADERLALAGLLREHNPALTILSPQDKTELAAIPASTLKRARLIGFLTPVIVPAPILTTLGYGAYNFHPGPPSYPGWLPSHFAVYDGVAFFGATAHEMAATVDSGPIVDLEMFGVPHGAGVAELEALTFIECVRLAWRLAKALATDPKPLPHLPVQWSGRRSTKAMIAAACAISPDIGKDELERRLAAFGGGHPGPSPFITLHGHTFRYVPPETAPAAAKPTLRKTEAA